MTEQKPSQESSALTVRVSSSASEYEGVRLAVEQTFRQSYVGWSSAVDRSFDDNATFLTLMGDNQLLGGIRLIGRRRQQSSSPQQVNPLPFELADNTEALPATGQISVEYSGLWARQARYSIALSVLAGQWVADSQPHALAAAVYPADNHLLRRLYLDSLGLAAVPDLHMRYPGLKHRTSGTAVDWCMALDLPGTRMQRLQQLTQRPYVRRILDRCEFAVSDHDRSSAGVPHQASVAGK